MHSDGGNVDQDAAVMLVVSIMVLGAVTLIAIALRGRQRLRELAIKERIAMIERGVVPPPEVDPERFDRLLLAYAVQRASNPKSTRYRTMGVMLMGLGAALFMLLAFAAGVLEIAFGVAGGVFVLGIATYVNGSLVARDVPPAAPGTPVATLAPPPASSTPAAATAPPDNVAP
jgi:hypothetical protein